MHGPVSTKHLKVRDILGFLKCGCMRYLYSQCITHNGRWSAHTPRLKKLTRVPAQKLGYILLWRASAAKRILVT